MILNSKTFLTAAAVLTAVRVLGADPAPLVYEQYVLDDGTILNGYTVTALPDNRTVFHTENAVRFLDADSAAQRFNLDDLTNARWLKDLDNKWLAFTLNYPDQVELLTPGGDPGMKVRLVATTFEYAEDIDAERAEQAKKRAEERLAEAKEEKDILLAKAKLSRALNRLAVVKE